MSELPLNRSESSEKRSINKLRNDIISARARWEKVVKENLITTRTAIGSTSRSPHKTLYIARDGAWWKTMKDEMKRLEERIARTAKKGSKQPRILWLPSVIENPNKIKLQIYPAYSTRKVSLVQARYYASKLGRIKPLSSKKSYSIRSATGNSYKLRITHKSKKSYVPFTEWAVCICRNESPIPALKKAVLNPEKFEFSFERSLCSNERSALFVRNKK